jgi:hypothetical protein
MSLWGVLLQACLCCHETQNRRGLRDPGSGSHGAPGVLSRGSLDDLGLLACRASRRYRRARAHAELLGDLSHGQVPPSRIAMAAISLRFVTTAGRPPIRPHAGAASRPARVRSWPSERSNSVNATNRWTCSWPPALVVSIASVSDRLVRRMVDDVASSRAGVATDSRSLVAELRQDGFIVALDQTDEAHLAIDCSNWLTVTTAFASSATADSGLLMLPWGRAGAVRT